MDKFEALQTHFGYTAFREGQEPLIDAQLRGQDVLGIMPTGAGKSLCFQIPALLLEGITLVISPLISLMKDQVGALCQAGVRAAYLNSSLTAAQYRKALDNAWRGVYKIIYVAPERLLTEEFLDFAQSVPISLVTVDEAHCISQWGQDFRPSYCKIPEFVRQLPQRPVLAAFTATATAQVKQDIARLLELRDPETLVTGFDRQNLYFEVAAPADKQAALKNFLAQRRDKSGIVYCLTRRAVEEVCAALQDAGYAATRYHAGLPPEERQQNQDDFLYDRAAVMVATNAFGMGIDKSNVSFVVHYQMPKNMEGYYQEAGRAGRDGEPAECVLYYSGQDVRTNQFLIENAEPNPELTEEEAEALKNRERERLRQMTFYCHTTDCLRAYILRYFGEKPSHYCGNCSNCNGHFEEVEVTDAAQQLLAAIRQLGQHFGAKMVVDVVRGCRNQRILTGHLDELPAFGALREMSESRIRLILEYLQQSGAVAVSYGEYPVLTWTAETTDILAANEPLRLCVPQEKAPPSRPKKRPEREVDSAMLSVLKALRARLATTQGVPAYVVFSDATLRDMCAKCPRTPDEMLEVSGVGQVKLEKYGQVFLKEIARLS